MFVNLKNKTFYEIKLEKFEKLNMNRKCDKFNSNKCKP